ncbi:MAG: response regulator [Phycisphaerales bacterium]
MSNDQQANATKSLRFPDAYVDLILNQLDNEPGNDKGASRRGSKRFPYRMASMPVKMQQPGSPNAALYLVPTRNLSSGGISFLHGGFVHNGTRILMQPVRQDGMWSDLIGKVVYCRYIERGVHEVCVEFDNEIDPSEFCAAAVTYDFLLVEDDDAIARLAEHHLGMLNIEVTRARNGQEAIDEATKGRFDCILMDMEMPVLDGWEAVKQLRASGYSGRIVAVTALNGPEDEVRCLEVGCNDYVPKPVMPGTFRKILEGVNEEPLQSRFHDDIALRDMIADFCVGLPAVIRELKELHEIGDFGSLGTAARRVRGSAGSFGFDPLAEAAGSIELSCVQDLGSEKIGLSVASFADLCKRVQSPVASRANRGDSGEDAAAAA